MQKPPNFLSVMLANLKVGTIGFGGGAALIPIIEKELVENKKWIDKERFDVSVAVASISPASLPVSIYAIWNSRYSLISAYSYALPGTLIYLTLLTGFSFIGEIGTKYLGFASVGLIAFVLFLIYRFIVKNYSFGAQSGVKRQYLLLIIASFILTCGNAVNRLFITLFDIQLPAPIFSVSMITLMLATFFVICFIGASKSKIKFLSALLIALLFSLVNGSLGILNQLLLPIVVLMVVMAAASITYDMVKNKKSDRKKISKIDLKPLRNLLLFILLATGLVLLTFLFSGDINVWDFTYRVITSSLSSFGGGEVYIGISEDVFVQTGFIPEYIFNTQIIGIANTMPGPVIVAIVAGIGYTYGSIHHGIGFGWIFGLLGLALTITATTIGALTLFMFFEILKTSIRLQMIIKYIMPVVCGMLISTVISLLRQASNVLIDLNVNPLISMGVIICIVILMLLVHKKYRVSDITLLLTAAVGTIIILGVMDHFAFFSNNLDITFYFAKVFVDGIHITLGKFQFLHLL